MYYFYSMYHERSKVTLTGICSTLPSPTKVQSKLWKAHLKRWGADPSLIKIKIIFQSDYLSEVRRWRDHYHALWDVKNNPKFINYLYAKKRPSMKGAKNPLHGKRIVHDKGMHWITNGRDNLFVSAGTNVAGYRKGRTIRYKARHNDITKKLMSQSHERKVVSPDGRVYDSLRKAGISEGVSGTAIFWRIRRGMSGWRYK